MTFYKDPQTKDRMEEVETSLLVLRFLVGAGCSGTVEKLIEEIPFLRAFLPPDFMGDLRMSSLFITPSLPEILKDYSRAKVMVGEMLAVDNGKSPPRLCDSLLTQLRTLKDWYIRTQEREIRNPTRHERVDMSTQVGEDELREGEGEDDLREGEGDEEGPILFSHEGDGPLDKFYNSLIQDPERLVSSLNEQLAGASTSKESAIEKVCLSEIDRFFDDFLQNEDHQLEPRQRELSSSPSTIDKPLTQEDRPCVLDKQEKLKPPCIPKPPPVFLSSTEKDEEGKKVITKGLTLSSGAGSTQQDPSSQIRYSIIQRTEVIKPPSDWEKLKRRSITPKIPHEITPKVLPDANRNDDKLPDNLYSAQVATPADQVEIALSFAPEETPLLLDHVDDQVSFSNNRSPRLRGLIASAQKFRAVTTSGASFRRAFSTPRKKGGIVRNLFMSPPNDTCTPVGTGDRKRKCPGSSSPPNVTATIGKKRLKWDEEPALISTLSEKMLKSATKVVQVKKGTLAEIQEEEIVTVDEEIGEPPSQFPSETVTVTNMVAGEDTTPTLPFTLSNDDDLKKVGGNNGRISLKMKELFGSSSESSSCSSPEDTRDSSLSPKRKISPRQMIPQPTSGTSSGSSNNTRMSKGKRAELKAAGKAAEGALPLGSWGISPARKSWSPKKKDDKPDDNDSHKENDKKIKDDKVQAFTLLPAPSGFPDPTPVKRGPFGDGDYYPPGEQELNTPFKDPCWTPFKGSSTSFLGAGNINRISPTFLGPPPTPTPRAPGDFSSLGENSNSNSLQEDIFALMTRGANTPFKQWPPPTPGKSLGPQGISQETLKVPQEVLTDRKKELDTYNAVEIQPVPTKPKQQDRTKEGGRKGEKWLPLVEVETVPQKEKKKTPPVEESEKKKDGRKSQKKSSTARNNKGTPPVTNTTFNRTSSSPPKNRPPSSSSNSSLPSPFLRNRPPSPPIKSRLPSPQLKNRPPSPPIKNRARSSPTKSRLPSPLIRNRPSSPFLENRLPSPFLTRPPSPPPKRRPSSSPSKRRPSSSPLKKKQPAPIVSKCVDGSKGRPLQGMMPAKTPRHPLFWIDRERRALAFSEETVIVIPGEKEKQISVASLPTPSDTSTSSGVTPTVASAMRVVLSKMDIQAFLQRHRTDLYST